MGLGFTEILLIFMIVLLFFGAKRLPEIAKAMGRAVSEFQHAKRDVLDGITHRELETKEDGANSEKNGQDDNADARNLEPSSMNNETKPE